MAVAHPLLLDSTWRDQQKYEAAEALYQQKLAGTATSSSSQHSCDRKLGGAGGAAGDGQLTSRPWDDETDMKELENNVRTIKMDGLVWGALEDDKVSTDDLEEKILAFEDFVQSMDIAAFNKI
ncbi:hypothetical protein KUTeg_000417 [Tegillarca granosa]|uniref:Translation elongation factor EF1B beta/delta subunit guanine nucleotide exchange domain-containing protein n=1 Tax=Tegillarca granosa TaxID=220873 RepID=A0ABQ9FYV3_TEGGR|nr:hypothetical protein KUTeg_000417 [Tegillarca granosa]